MTPENRIGGAMLAIDTSTEQAGVAAQHGGSVASLTWHAGRSHTVHLLDQIHRLLELSSLEPGDIGGIAVAIGPGAFTGLRVGLSAAKGFCLALDAPIVGVSTLAAAAAGALAPERRTIAVVTAGRGRIAWASFSPDASGLPGELTSPINTTPAELAAAIAAAGDAPLVTGELGESAGLLAQSGGLLVPNALRGRRPEALLAIAAPRFASGKTDDPVSLEPMYLSR